VCRRGLLSAPGRGQNTIPVSEWVGTSTAWQPESEATFVSDLSADVMQGPGPLRIVAVAGNPPAEVTVDGASVLPVTSNLAVLVVVSDTASTEVSGVRVVVSIRPTGTLGVPHSSSSTSSIGPGQSVSFHPAALDVQPGASYSLVITATADGPGASASRSYQIRIASANGGAGR
jgi:hypothetical protein